MTALPEAQYNGEDLLQCWQRRMGEAEVSPSVAMAKMAIMVSYMCACSTDWLEPQYGHDFLPDLKYFMEDSFHQHKLGIRVPA